MKRTVMRIWRFYYDGFSQMKLGRTLWLIILIKLFILFFVLKLFFFPDYLNTVASDDEEGYVSKELIDRRIQE